MSIFVVIFFIENMRISYIYIYFSIKYHESISNIFLCYKQIFGKIFQNDITFKGKYFVEPFEALNVETCFKI